MKAEEPKTKGTHAARSFGMVACWKGEERKGTEKQSLKTCRHAMLLSPSAGLTRVCQSFWECRLMLLSSEPTFSTKVLFLQDDSAALTLTLRAAPHPCLVNRGCKDPFCLGQLGMLVKD